MHYGVSYGSADLIGPTAFYIFASSHYIFGWRVGESETVRTQFRRESAHSPVLPLRHGARTHRDVVVLVPIVFNCQISLSSRMAAIGLTGVLTTMDIGGVRKYCTSINASKYVTTSRAQHRA